MQRSAERAGSFHPFSDELKEADVYKVIDLRAAVWFRSAEHSHVHAYSGHSRSTGSM